jgi:HSP20 family molecular chaperone IbpA
MLTPSIFSENLYDDFFDDLFDFPRYGNRGMQKGQRRPYGRPAANMMRTDVQEHEDHYQVDIDLPGFSKDDITLELKEGYLIINAIKKVEQGEKDKESSKYICRERYVGSMSRSFFVGKEVKQEDIHARFEDGVLKLSVPKMQEGATKEEKRYIAIEG